MRRKKAFLVIDDEVKNVRRKNLAELFQFITLQFVIVA